MSTQFEKDLRAALAGAVVDAPRFEAARHQTSQRVSRGRSRWTPFVLAAGAAAVAGLGWQWSHSLTSGSGPEASCAARLSYDGRDYSGAAGNAVRTPAIGEPLGEATIPACQDSPAEQVGVSTLAALGGTDVVMTGNGQVWIADGVNAPPLLEEARQPVRCTTAGALTLTGQWVAVQGPMPERDYELVAPFRMDLNVEAAQAGLDPKIWEAATITIAVGKDVAVPDRDSVRRALGEGAPITVEATCAKGEFVATRVG